METCTAYWITNLTQCKNRGACVVCVCGSLRHMCVTDCLRGTAGALTRALCVCVRVCVCAYVHQHCMHGFKPQSR